MLRQSLLSLLTFLLIISVSVFAQDVAWELKYPYGAIPTDRTYPAMTYHMGRKVVVLFGGGDTTGNFNDLMVFDG